MSIEVNNYIISFPNVDLSEYATFPTQPTDAVYELIEQSKSGNSIYRGTIAYGADKSSEKHPAENLVTATWSVLNGAEITYWIFDEVWAVSSFNFE